MKFHDIAQNLITPRHPIEIHLAGCGGTGSQLLTGLARIDHSIKALDQTHPGFHVTCFDPDTVSEFNIGRQLFSPSDINQFKASVLTERVNRFFGLSWEAVPVLYEKVKQTPAILITAVDTAKARINIRKGIKDNCYWLDVGNFNTGGQVVLGSIKKFKQASPAASEKLPTILDLYPNLQDQDDDDNTPSCSMREALERQDLFINQLVSTFALNLIWSMFKEVRLKIHGCFIDSSTYSTRPLYIQ